MPLLVYNARHLLSSGSAHDVKSRAIVSKTSDDCIIRHKPSLKRPVQAANN